MQSFCINVTLKSNSNSTVKTSLLKISSGDLGLAESLYLCILSLKKIVDYTRSSHLESNWFKTVWIKCIAGFTLSEARIVHLGKNELKSFHLLPLLHSRGTVDVSVWWPPVPKADVRSQQTALAHWYKQQSCTQEAEWLCAVRRDLAELPTSSSPTSVVNISHFTILKLLLITLYFP